MVELGSADAVGVHLVVLSLQVQLLVIVINLEDLLKLLRIAEALVALHLVAISLHL